MKLFWAWVKSLNYLESNQIMQNELLLVENGAVFICCLSFRIPHEDKYRHPPESKFLFLSAPQPVRFLRVLVVALTGRVGL